MNDIDLIKTYKDLIHRLEEADEDPLTPAITPDEATDTAANVPPAPAEAGTVDQTADDKEIKDVMTDTSDNASKKISLITLATDLELDNPELFKQAFLQLQSGNIPEDEDSLKELSNAFLKIMSMDASTTQRTINRLRSIYKKMSSNV